MARYWLRFRHQDTGLTPTFTYFKKSADLSNQVSPAISELANGAYYFDFTPTSDIVFEVDGGASIPVEEIRYITDTISPRDIYLDEPITQVYNDVWNDTTDRAVNTKGQYVESIGLPADTSSASTVFGKMASHKESIKGADDRDITQIAGAGTFIPGADDLHQIKTGVNSAQPALTADAVWDEAAGDHVASGSVGELMTNTANYAQRTLRVSEGRWKIFTTGPDTNRLVLYDQDGTTVLQKWDLKDSAGSAATADIFERIPVNSVP